MPLQYICPILFPKIDRHKIRLVCLVLLQVIAYDDVESFQSAWRKFSIVVVKGCHNHLTASLWTPESLKNDYKEKRFKVIDSCSKRTMIMTSEEFYSLFDLEDPQKPWKVKDWPNSSEFEVVMRDRFCDFMNGLPLKGYTHSDGRLNLVHHLPVHLSRPDLGPKMFCALGQTRKNRSATTRLHVDVGDAVNILMHATSTLSHDGTCAIRY